MDEIGELPIDLQPKLLRVLQEGEYDELGATKTTQVDVRVIAATNRNLEQMMEEGRFRQDLFYRLNVFCIHVFCPDAKGLHRSGTGTYPMAGQRAQRRSENPGHEPQNPVCQDEKAGDREASWLERLMVLKQSHVLWLERDIVF